MFEKEESCKHLNMGNGRPKLYDIGLRSEELMNIMGDREE